MSVMGISLSSLVLPGLGLQYVTKFFTFSLCIISSITANVISGSVTKAMMTSSNNLDENSQQVVPL